MVILGADIIVLFSINVRGHSMMMARLSPV